MEKNVLEQEFSIISDVRGHGLFLGIELMKNGQPNSKDICSLKNLTISFEHSKKYLTEKYLYPEMFLVGKSFCEKQPSGSTRDKPLIILVTLCIWFVSSPI